MKPSLESGRMRRTIRWPRRFAACALLLVALVSTGFTAGAQEKTPFPKMAPLEEYLMEPKAEIALARSSAPASISDEAEVLVLGRHGYETAVKGKNGFVCYVERAWMSGSDDPEFWDPKLRGPMCLNAAGAKMRLPMAYKKTELVLGGASKEQIVDAMKVAFDKKELPAPEPGAMCYMMSKDAYFGAAGQHWHPHLMFFWPSTESMTWGAAPGSPVLAFQDPEDRMTVFVITLGKWSDGTAAPPYEPEEEAKK